MLRPAIHADIQRANKTPLYHRMHVVANTTRAEPLVAKETDRRAWGGATVAASPGFAVAAPAIKDNLPWTRFANLDVPGELLLLEAIVAEYSALAPHADVNVVSAPRCGVSAIVDCTAGAGDEVGIIPDPVFNHKADFAEPTDGTSTAIARALVDALGAIGSAETVEHHKRRFGRTTVGLRIRVVPPVTARGPI